MVRKTVTCISLLFVGCGISYFCTSRYSSIKDLTNNELLIGKYFSKQITEEKEDYIALLEIPKINFKRGLYKQDSLESDLDKNIIFLDVSDMPDADNSRVIIVGHSGAVSNAYFKYLYKLKLNSKIYLYYNNVKYYYEVKDIYEVTKNGTLALESSRNEKTLTLVTCKGSNKQLVVVSTLTKEEKYS